MGTKRIHFDRFTIDRDARELLRDGQVQEIEPKALQLLELLASRPGHTFDKDELGQAVWPGRFISDSVIAQAICKIRQVTSDSASDQRVIKTVHGVGYRFVAQLRPAQDFAVRPGRGAWRWTLAGAVMIIAVASIGIHVSQRGAPATDSTISAAILPFVNATEDEQLDWLGAGLPGLLASGLSNQPRLELVDGGVVAALERDLHRAATSAGDASDERIRTLLGADLLIAGEVRGQPDAWELILRIDQPDGARVEQRITVTQLTELITNGADPLVRQTLNPGRVATPGDYSDDPFVNETYARGLASESAGDNIVARDLFVVVTRLNTDFLPGLLALARIQQYMGELDAAEASVMRLREKLQVGPRQVPPGMQVDLIRIEGLIAFGRGQTAQAQEYFAQALELARQQQLVRSEGELLRHLGMVASHAGDGETAERRYSESLAIFTREQYQPGMARAYNSLGSLAWRREMINESERWHQRALDAFRLLGRRDAEHISLGNLAAIAASRGQVETAIELYTQVLEHHRHTGNRESEVLVLGNLARNLVLTNRLHEARAVAHEMRTLAAALGLTGQVAYADLQLGSIHARLRDYPVAVMHLERAAEAYEQSNDRAYQLSSIAHLIRALLFNDQPERARQLHDERHELLDTASGSVRTQVLWAQSLLMVAEGRVEEGIVLIEQARALARASGAVEAANSYTAVLAELLLRAGRTDSAEPLIAQLDSFGGRFIPYWLLQARFAYENHQFEQALGWLEQAREHAGDIWAAHLNEQYLRYQEALAGGLRIALGDEL